MFVGTPDPPGLNISLITNDTITLLITKPSNTGGVKGKVFIRSYEIYKNGTRIRTVAATRARRMKITIDSLISKTPYTFAVRAFNDIEFSKAVEVHSRTAGTLGYGLSGPPPTDSSAFPLSTLGLTSIPYLLYCRLYYR